MTPNSYILLTIQLFRTKIYIPNLSQITEGVLKVSCFHISSRQKRVQTSASKKILRIKNGT